jgi:hypothetical protein
MDPKHFPIGFPEPPKIPDISRFSAAALSSPHSLNPAKWMHERLVRSINDFEKGLDANHEVGAHLVNFGSMTFHVTDVGYWGPDIIKFYGEDDQGKPIELLQHLSQLSVLLMAIQKKDAQARRIGFRMLEELERE